MRKPLSGAVIIGFACASTLALAGTVRHLEWFGPLTTGALSGMAVAGQPETSLKPAVGPDRQSVAIQGFDTFAKLATYPCALRAVPVTLDTDKHAQAGATIRLGECPTQKRSFTVPEGMAVRGIQVCSSFASSGKGIGGMRLWSSVLNANGTVQELPGAIETVVDSTCTWRGKSMCPAGQVAVEAIALVYNGKEYSGLKLRCAKVRKP